MRLSAAAKIFSEVKTRFFAPIMAIVLAVGFIAFTRTALWQSQDFSVFWWAGRHLAVEQIPVYDVARDGAMAFKYPPWAAPLFVPLALFPVEIAKFFWAMISVGSLVYCLVWLRSHAISLSQALWVALLFWGLWAVHMMDGQIMLPILAVCLFGFDHREKAWARALVYLALSIKVTPLGLGVVWFKREWRDRFRGVGLAVVFAVVLTLPAAWVGARADRPVIQHWISSMSSTGDWFEGEKSRGRDNQGITALVLRKAEIPAADRSKEFWVGLGVFALLWAVFLFYANRLRSDERAQWLGGLCIVAAVHPLAWFHTFVLCFPAAAVVLGQKKNLLPWLAVVMIALITRQTLGVLGAQLELSSIKGLGALLLAVLVLNPSIAQQETNRTS